MRQITIIFIFILFTNCKKEQDKNRINTLENNKITKKADSNDSIKEIYIGKHFVAGVELNYFSVEDSKDIVSIDSLSYSIYKSISIHNYIFSLEKFIKEEDVAEYKIIDTVNLKSKNIEVEIEEFSDYKALYLFLDKKLVKEWKFKIYPKATKSISIINNWLKDNIEIHISKDNITYIFHGQCVYAFPVKIINDNEVELIWGYIGRDCVYEVLFEEMFDLPKEKIPQKGKPFSKYTIENNVVKVTYYYNEWLEKYRKKMKENDKPFPFLNSFSLKT